MRCGGGHRRENVGISSKKTGENPVHRKLKVSWATIIVSGLGGPKARLKSVVDGQQVNIPALQYFWIMVTYLRWFKRAMAMCVPRHPVGEETTSSDRVNLSLRDAKKNYNSLRVLYPYRKPTQVSGKRILRCTREPLFRN